MQDQQQTAPETTESLPIKHENLVTAMFYARSQMVAVIKGSTARIVDTRNNREKSYKYTNIADVIDMMQPALFANGLLVTQDVQRVEGERVLVTCVTHIFSRENKMFATPMVADERVSSNPVQAFGSTITYTRRYALLTLFNLAAEDDDGKSADIDSNATGGQNKSAPPPPPPPVTPKESASHAALRDLATLCMSAKTKQELTAILGKNGKLLDLISSEPATAERYKEWLENKLNKLEGKVV